jgi:ferredoxin
MDRLDSLRQAVRELLDAGEVEGVLALRSDHGGTVPHLFQSGDDLMDLALWPKFPMPSTVDLLLTMEPETKLGVVIRGCDERGLVEMAKRNQVDLARLTLLGVACLPDEVAHCPCSKPYPSEISVGEPLEGVADARVAEHAQLGQTEKLAFWNRQFAKCFKCYACRDVCPQCFCEDCVLENDLWVERGVLAPPFPSFHLIRALHTVGKCIGCHECELSCPADIPLTILYSLLRQDAETMFGYVPGASVEDEPPLVIAGVT